MRAATAFGLLVLTACHVEDPYQLLSLPSGKQIRVLSVVKMHVTAGNPALVLRYQTDQSVDDLKALKAEALEIWPTFQVNVENAGLTNAAISAIGKTKPGFIRTGQAYTFVFQKSGPNGEWQILPEKSGQ